MAEEQEDEFRLMLEEEMDSLRDRKKQLEEKLRIMLLPKDPDDDKSVIMEIRAGTGGEEAALFANDLFRMYSRYAESQGWKIDIMESHFTDIGGIKELIFVVDGPGAIANLYESGV